MHLKSMLRWNFQAVAADVRRLNSSAAIKSNNKIEPPYAGCYDGHGNRGKQSKKSLVLDRIFPLRVNFGLELAAADEVLKVADDGAAEGGELGGPGPCIWGDA